MGHSRLITLVLVGIIFVLLFKLVRETIKGAFMHTAHGFTKDQRGFYLIIVLMEAPIRPIGTVNVHD